MYYILVVYLHKLKYEIMKKLFFILTSLIVLQSVNGQIKVRGFVEAGYLNETYALNNEGYVSYYQSGNALYSDITLDFSLKNVHLETQLFNVFDYQDGKAFSVAEIEYKTRLFYKWKFLAIGYEHSCLHPIINQHNELPQITRRGSHDKIFLRFTFNNAN